MEQANLSALVIGASSGIAQALIQHLLNNTQLNLVCISQQALSFDSPRVQHMQSDYSDLHITQLAKELRIQDLRFEQVYICNGLLHSDAFMPEKKLNDVNSAQLQGYFQANVVVPMLWLAQLEFLQLTESAQITVFSARVASIGDNRLGGWYGYRGTKSALNMMVKSAAIEHKRKHKGWQFVLFHPGTTDTRLSKPFQANVKDENLFTPEFVAEQLLLILTLIRAEAKTASEPVSYLDWQGKPIEW